MSEELIAAIRVFIMENDPSALLKYINDQAQIGWEKGYSAGLDYFNEVTAKYLEGR